MHAIHWAIAYPGKAKHKNTEKGLFGKIIRIYFSELTKNMFQFASAKMKNKSQLTSRHTVVKSKNIKYEKNLKTFTDIIYNKQGLI